MPQRGQQLGKRRPFVRRPGIGKFPPWDGMNREGDPASVPPNAFRMLINVRIDDSEIRCRGGQTSINPDDALDGCVTGVFPPEHEPPDQSYKRLLITERVTGEPDQGATYILEPTVLADPTELIPGVENGVTGMYWSGQRLLILTEYQSDFLFGGVKEYTLVPEDGATTIAAVVAPNGIQFSWHGQVGGVVLFRSDYFLGRYDDAASSADSVRLEFIEFGTTDFVFDNQQANDIADFNATSPCTFVTSAPDDRIIWLSKATSVAQLTIRATSAGTYSQVNFPTGFEPIDTNIHAWAWHAGKLYIAGALSSDLAICAYDPVLNTISTVRTISGTNPDHCPMAVHKGVLYFAYGLDGGAERVGMLKTGTWTNSIAAFPAPADFYDLCSFQDHLYATKDDFLFRCANPSVDPTFETFYQGLYGFPLGAMVAVP